MDCPECRQTIGGPSKEGGVRARLAITLIDEDGRVHGPCPHCKADVTVASGARVEKAERLERPESVRIGLRVRRRLALTDQ